MKSSHKYKLKSPDWWIFFSTMVLVCIGIIMVFSSSQYFTQYKPYEDIYYYLKKQLQNAAVGLVAMYIMYRVNYRLYKAVAWYAFFGVCAVLIILVLGSGGQEVKGAVRWIDLGFTTFQPSELAKLSLIMLLAKLLTEKQRKIGTFQHGFLPPLILMGITSVLVYLQNDLSTSVIIAGTAFIMMFCAGVKLPYLFGTVALGGSGVAASILFTDFRMGRIMSYLDPWADPLGGGFQTVQSLLAIGSGGLTGVGLGAGGAKWYYLPERHTDFIFSVLAEELGFLGGVLVITLFIVLIWRGLMVAVNAPDLFGSLLALGIISMIGLQAFMNLGVVTGLLPVTGITLPFVSYGGTSLLISMASIGLLLNISRYAEMKR